MRGRQRASARPRSPVSGSGSTLADAALLRALIQDDLKEQADTVLRQYREVFQTPSTAYEHERVCSIS